MPPAAPPARSRVHQDLTIVGVRPSPTSVEAVVRTPAGRAERISFEVPDGAALLDHVDLLRTWMHRGTPVTYVVSGGSGVLLDEAATFAAAFGTPDLH